MVADTINQMLVETAIPAERRLSTTVISLKRKEAKDSYYEFLTIVKSCPEVNWTTD